MHELSIARAVLDAALRHAGGRPVTAVALRVGAMRQVVPDSLGFYFELAARDTLCAGARLDQERVAALLRCRTCGREWDPAPPPPAAHPAGVPPLPRFRCPACEAHRVDLVRGDELEVASIEIAEVSVGAGAEGAPEGR